MNEIIGDARKLILTIYIKKKLTIFNILAEFLNNKRQYYFEKTKKFFIENIGAGANNGLIHIFYSSPSTFINY